MNFKYFSRNGEIRPIEEAVVPLSSIEYQYGFGVYETLRVVDGIPYFLDDHTLRLMESARIIGLEHVWNEKSVEKAVKDLTAKTGSGSYNLKILLIGPSTSLRASGSDAKLFILGLNPHFPDKKLYRDGASFITYEYERPFPHAKTLNMLESFLAYREAKGKDCYDALLLDHGNILEGTRTNFLTIKDRAIYSPPEDRILLGVTRKAVLAVAKKKGFEIAERDIPLRSVTEFDGAFITSTSSKIMPIHSIDGITLSPPPQTLRELMSAFDEFLSGCAGVLP